MEIIAPTQTGHPRAEIATRRARKLAELETLERLARKRLGAYAGPSSATIPPPPSTETNGS